MPKNNPQWRHHYVPEFYLKRWQLGGDRFVEYSKAYESEVSYRWVSPKQTGFMDKLYFLQHLPEQLRNRYEEKFFKKVDTKAAAVLEKIEAGNFELTAKERSSWSRFVMSLMFRTPECLDAVRARLADDVYYPTPVEERRYRRARQLGDPRTLREALVAHRDDDYNNEVALEVAASVADSKRVGQVFIDMLWGYRRLPFHTPALMTSDRPIMWAKGMSDSDCHIIIPVGPKAIFWAARSMEVVINIRNIDASALVAFLNDHLTRRAKKYVWATTRSHLAYVQERMGVDAPETIPDLLIKQQWQSLQRPLAENGQRNRRR